MSKTQFRNITYPRPLTTNSLHFLLFQEVSKLWTAGQIQPLFILPES